MKEYCLFIFNCVAILSLNAGITGSFHGAILTYFVYKYKKRLIVYINIYISNIGKTKVHVIVVVQYAQQIKIRTIILVYASLIHLLFLTSVDKTLISYRNIQIWNTFPSLLPDVLCCLSFLGEFHGLLLFWLVCRVWSHSRLAQMLLMDLQLHVVFQHYCLW